MTKIYRKTGTIKAEQFNGSNEMVKKYHMKFDDEYIWWLRFETLDGLQSINIYDWIATGVNGDHWLITDDVFKKMYAELPVIPKVWGDTIEEFKANHYRLSEIFDEWDWNYDE